jgi:Zn-dependent M28 family amino/carboxypeptidase
MTRTISWSLTLALVGLLAAPATAAHAQTRHKLRPAPTPSRALSAAEKQAAARISAREIIGHIRFLADDLLEGRAPASRGDLLTQRYIAAQMEAAGLSPGGPDGGWLQPVPLVGITTRVPKAVSFTGRGKRVSLKLGTDLAINAGTQQPKAAIRGAELVFVGYGIVAPEYGWDDYKDVDVNGKVVVVMNNDPSSDPALFAGKTRLWYGRWDYKYLQAAQKGAVGAIIIHTDESASYPWAVIGSSRGEEFELPAGPDEPRLTAKMWATEDASKRLVALGGKDLDALRAAAETREFRPAPLGVKLSVALTNTLRTVESANVLGLLPGSDPKLKDEVVIFTAHHDHLGVGAPDKDGDAIYNGALDNASGVGALLAIARAAAAGPAPKRSLLFMTVAAEEQGLLGSGWYARNPTFAPGRIAANLNLDSINRLGRTTDIGFIGRGKSTIDDVVDAVARAQGRVVKGDPNPERGSFYRSDQFNFARIGVPALFARGGPTYVGKPAGWGEQQTAEYTAKHYHQPSDHFDPSWDLSGAVEDAQLYLIVALRIAGAERMPSWKPGDEFEAARKAALEAVARGR